MKVALVLSARPSYAKLKPIISALVGRGVDVQLISCASALLERYGKVSEVAREDFPHIYHEDVYSTYEGTSLLTSAKETGALLVELCAVLQRLRPDAVCVIADRHEVLAAAQSAAYLHIPLIHCQGGERTGSIDDKIRDSITHLADWHCVATERAQYRVYSLIGDMSRIARTGCPSIDVAKEALSAEPVTFEELQGTGPRLDLSRPFLVVLQHPVTSEADQAYDQMWTTLEAVSNIPLPRIVFQPGEDAGADQMAKAIRAYRHQHPSQTFVTVKNFAPVRFLKLLTQSACLVGNSSAGIRESSYLGVPVVNIGSRQFGRERAQNVEDVSHNVDDIRASTLGQASSKYASSELYGSGQAGEQIAEVICGRVGAGSGQKRQ